MLCLPREWWLHHRFFWGGGGLPRWCGVSNAHRRADSYDPMFLFWGQISLSCPCTAKEGAGGVGVALMCGRTEQSLATHVGRTFGLCGPGLVGQPHGAERHWRGGLAHFEGWKPQTAGGCGWNGCPLESHPRGPRSGPVSGRHSNERHQAHRPCVRNCPTLSEGAVVNNSARTSERNLMRGMLSPGPDTKPRGQEGPAGGPGLGWVCVHYRS